MLNLFRSLSSCGSDKYRPSARLLYVPFGHYYTSALQCCHNILNGSDHCTINSRLYTFLCLTSLEWYGISDKNIYSASIFSPSGTKFSFLSLPLSTTTRISWSWVLLSLLPQIVILPLCSSSIHGIFRINVIFQSIKNTTPCPFKTHSESRTD